MVVLVFVCAVKGTVLLVRVWILEPGPVVVLVEA